MAAQSIPDLSGKVAIVTGASKGIGRAVAERLAQAGARVVVNYASDVAEAEAVVAAIEGAGGVAVAVRGDVASAADVDALYDAAARWGAPDILVVNAGIGSVASLVDGTEAQYQRMFDVNTRGTMLLLRGAASHLANNGRVVTVSSATVAFPQAMTAIYAGSKAAVEAMSLVAAEELGPRGITVNIVQPGVTDTPLVAALPHRDELVRIVAANSPFKRIGTPGEVASVITFLISDEASWVTGQTICVNGGAKL